MAQTAEGSLNEINNNLQRVRELAVQASNGTNSTSDLASLQDEVTARLAEINRVAGKTDFNGIKLLDGTAGTAGVVKIQVGVNDGDTIDLDLSGAKADTTTLGVNCYRPENYDRYRPGHHRRSYR
jgi:flagellin